MALSQKRPLTTGEPVLDRVLSDVYRDINEVINAVNSGDSNRVKPINTGKSGDIRVVKDSTLDDNNYFIEIKTDDGWTRLSTSLYDTALPDWTVTNKASTSRALNADGSAGDIADRLAQLVDDLISARILQ